MLDNEDQRLQNAERERDEQARNGQVSGVEPRELDEIRPSNWGWDKLFTPPVLPNQEDRRIARLLHTTLLILIAGTVAIYLTTFSTENPLRVLVVVTGLLAVEIAAFIILQRGRARLAAGILVGGLWLALFSISLIAAGVSNSPFIALLLVIVIAGLILGGRAGQLFALLNALAGLGLVYLEVNGLLPRPLVPFNLVSFWISLSVVFFAVAGLISLATRDLRETLQRAQVSEQAQIASNRELQDIRASLERQITERTRDLEQRTNYLQAAFEVSRAAASILSADQLLHEVVNLIRDQFNLYYVGLFLTDTGGEWAILRAGTGMAGKIMLERGHRIQIGSGMIGWSIANSQPRLALEAGADAVRLATPELPETRSEVAIPLFSRGKVLGALSVQSTKANAFGETEISAFQIMADQVAIALDNAKLFAESLKALDDAQRAYGEISRHAWQEFLRQGADLSYRYQNNAITSISPSDLGSRTRARSPQLRSALMKGEPWQTIEGGNATLFLPIMVRGQVIGVINVAKQNTDHGWTEQETGLLRTIVDQLGVALDSARLYRDTQRLAYREQLTSEVTMHIRETLDIDTVLRTAVQEVQKVLGVPEVVITLKNSDESDAASSSANRSGMQTDGHKSQPDDHSDLSLGN